jgi:hypothetical protein
MAAAAAATTTSSIIHTPKQGISFTTDHYHAITELHY